MHEYPDVNRVLNFEKGSLLIKLIGLILLWSVPIIAIAQKLPNIQKVSLRAPASIKIDGKSTEWRNEFQAYNHATEIYYSIANDDENSYLIIQAVKPRVIDKIIDVGVTFIVNNSGKKSNDDKENITVTYPNIDVKNGQRIIIYAGNKRQSDIVVPKLILDNMPKDTVDKLPSSNHDSLIAIANDLLVKNANTIKITGVDGVSDDQVSVYNEQRIRVASSFDKEGTYNYELSIPFTCLRLSTGTNQKFSYSIRINGRLVEPKVGTKTRYIYPNGQQVDVDQDLDSTTDFWGEYTLAKK